jgi:hypothetical protein
LIDPGLASILLAFGLAGICGLPGVHRALKRRRDLKRFCLSCGRRLVNGIRQCACNLD